MCAIGVAGGNAYLHSGLYTFELGDADARTPVEARFSYVWRKVDGMWKISHHHSSVRPKQPEEVSCCSCVSVAGHLHHSSAVASLPCPCRGPRKPCQSWDVALQMSSSARAAV